MLWDVFCKVIDNFGDIGVCWRLARDLASRGEQVRLWVDDASALAWMAPEVGADGDGHPGVQVLPWPDTVHPLPRETTPGDVVIEAFGCEPPPDFVERMQRPAPPQWINLEYLSAEDYVERSHGLPSPVLSGPGTGLHKRFFYPGFTTRTGGLLRERGLISRRNEVQADDDARASALHRLGVNWQTGQRVVTLFCYADSPVHDWLDALATAHAASALPLPCQVLLTPGPAVAQALGWKPQTRAPGGSVLRLQALPPLPQPDFDTLLWCSDLNMVRGEDSAVRALWAARPHVWQIYRQDDGVHAGKLDAFISRWMADWPPGLRQDVSALWRAWNHSGSDGRDWSALERLWSGPALQAWQEASARSCDSLIEQQDLVSQLLPFVTGAR